MSLRETCLTHAVAAAALLSLHVVEARAGQNEGQWMVFDRDSASRLVETLADSAQTPE